MENREPPSFHCGQTVRWRNPVRAEADGWVATYGSGPFEVLFIIDRSWQDLPDGLIVQTKLGQREINSIWLTAIVGAGQALSGPVGRPFRVKIISLIEGD